MSRRTILIGVFNIQEMVKEWKEFLGLTEKAEKNLNKVLDVEEKITEEKRKQLDLFIPLEKFAFGIERAAEQHRISDLEGGDKEAK